MLYKLPLVILTTVIITACADGAGDHVNPLTIFAAQLAQGTLGSHSESSPNPSTPHHTQTPPQNISTLPPETEPQTPPQSAPAPLAIAPQPAPRYSASASPLNTPW